MSHFGLIQDEKDSRDYIIHPLLMEENVYLDNDWPKRVDYSNQMTEVKNQGNLGSCVAFAVSATREWQEWKEYQRELQEEGKKKGHRKGKKYDLSEAWIYWNCKKIDKWPNSEGTSIRAAMKVLNQLGAPPEKAWPYTDNSNKKGKPKNWANMIARWHMIKSYHRITKWQDLKRSIAHHGPVVAGVYVYNGFYYPNEWGVVPMPSSRESPIGAHANCICGFDDNRRSLIFKNSWGKDWGMKGFGQLSYDYWHEGHMLDVWEPTDLDVNINELKGETNKLKD